MSPVGRFVSTMPLVTLAAFAALALVPGCKSGSGGAQPAASASASAVPVPSASASAAPRRLKLMRRQGVTAYAFNSARDVTLTDEQMDALEKLEDQASAGDPEMRAAFQQYQTDINAGIQAGKFDKDKLKADYDALDKAAATNQQNDAQALNGLYTTLTAEERSTLVTNLRARESAFNAHRPPDQPEAGAARRKELIDRMTQDLTLDAAQQRKVAAALEKQESASSGPMASRELLMKRLDLVLNGFDKDGFDASKLDLEGADKAHESQEHEAEYLMRVVAILTPEQRVKFATERAHPMPMMPHGFMGGPGGMKPMGGAPFGPGHPGPGAPPGAPVAPESPKP